jgi:Flp pilus assembly protein TadG
MRFRDEEGQAIVIVALAMSIFLIGAVGLGIDGAHLYAQRQMAQSAADATALAAITSIFQGTAGAPTTGFSTSSAFTCTTTDTRTPCVFASKNGFGGASSDTVTIDFPASVPGVPSSSLSPDYPVNIVRATVKRDVSTTLMRLLGPTLTNVSANATAAIAYVISPVPILVTHPTLPSALSMNGTPNVKICGGPRRSIQVNSRDPAANAAVGNSTIDLSHAGPLDPGNCTTGTGSDYGTRGGPNTPPFTFLSGVGSYLPHDLIMQDPLANVSPPSVPTVAGTSQPLANGTSGCPASPKKACQLYFPGLYTKIDGKNSTPVFVPGIYYIQGTQGFDCSANCDIYMATGYTDPNTGTGWTGNVLFYNTGPTSNPTNAGAFNLSANGVVNLVGSPTGSSYKGILFFQDRSSVAQSHALGGGGSMTLQGTIYLTNTIATMSTTSSQYQSLSLQGGPGSGTLIQGEIIVGTLSLGGNGNITMNLDPNGYLYVSQIALVN